ncbi:hypothetical protein [Okeania sp. KiyG1]|uniref:hypothetical protein n=1 Tax=Okeania sp. KiyG1 TaxID=2720165 RepID=UPI00192467F0|nr:hypothetical protein [Okeania sp. KiyG1]GGA08695.1 hypothetical protein CYANOKiyG1_21520 [Okeania sp. KiyG1]
MAKSNQRQNKNKSQPDTRKLKPIEIDETIISGKTGKLNNGENITISVPIEDFYNVLVLFKGWKKMMKQKKLI